MSQHVFLTGVTGYIGSHILTRWLDRTDHTLSLLVRPRREDKPQARLQKILREFYPDRELSHLAKRIRLVEGDVSLERLGLSESEYQALADNTSHIIHGAAAARFDLEIEEARRTNVGGVENIIALAKASPSLARMDYIGTAYVAGKRNGIIREDDLDMGQEHRNTYEQSKCEAEKLVRSSMGELPVAILRPSIVICDSKTGRASSYNGFHRMMQMFHAGALKALPGYPESVLDLVPVDYVCDALFSISAQEKSLGKCHHLTAGLHRGTTLEEIGDLASFHFRKERFVLIPPEEFNLYLSKMRDRLNEKEQKMMDEVRLYMPYVTSDLHFDNTQTLQTTGLEAPPVSTYFGKLAEFIEKQNASLRRDMNPDQDPGLGGIIRPGISAR